MDVETWLRGLGLEQYAEAFQANAIDAHVLPELTADDVKELGVSLVGHRRKLLAAIAALRADRSIENKDPSGPRRPSPNRANATSRESQPSVERRRLTIMFCDLVGSTALSSRLDPEDLHEVIGAYYQCCAEVVQSFDGYLARYMGDGVLVYFGYPEADESDAERAVRAGLALIDQIGHLSLATARLDARVGIATGLVVVGDMIGDGEAQERSVVGETPNLAARLQALAAPNSVLISENTRRLIGELFELRDAGSVELRGLGSTRVWQALWPSSAVSRFEALRASSLTPLVGREEEIELLLRRWDRAKAGNGQVVLLSGEAGIGKPRIVAAFEGIPHGVEHVRVRLSASPHHRESTLHPVVAHLERAAGFAREDSLQTKLDKLELLVSQSEPHPAETAALFAELLGVPDEGRYPRLELDPHGKRERTLAALIRQFEALACRQPILLIIEDMHWVDSTSRQLLELVIERAPRLAVLCLITSRPESAPSWVGQAHVTMLSLRRLDEPAATALIQNVAGSRGLPSEIVDQIVARTDGIPLFLEELTKSLLESDALREEDHRYVVNRSLPLPAIPSSLHDLLLARFDRVADAKEIAQVAAALGRDFSFELLAMVAGWDDGQLHEALQQLIAAGLILSRGIPPHESFIFKHALMQDAAYSTLLRYQRQELHARIASVLNEQFPEAGDNQPELLAHHYTQAGLTDPAVEYWRKAGERALKRSANVEATQHLRHGLALTPALCDTAERQRREFELYLVLGPATRAINGHAAPETLEAFANARDRLGSHATVKETMSVLYGLFGVHFVRGEHTTAQVIARETAALAAAHSDPDVTAQADALLGHVLWAMGEFIEARACLERALDTGPLDTRAPGTQRFSHNHRVAVLLFLALTLWALGYPERAVIASREAVARARQSGHVPLTAYALHGEAFLTIAFGADPNAGAERADEAASYCVEHGITTYEHWARFYQGMVSAQRGDPRFGIEVMRCSIEAAARLHAGLLHPVHLGNLAVAHARSGRLESGIELLTSAIEEIAETHEFLFEAELHRLRGELLIEMGREGEAEAEFDLALSVARRQDARLWELRAATSRAQLWRRQGRCSEAREILAPIFGWFTEGFATPDLKAAKSLLTVLS